MSKSMCLTKWLCVIPWRYQTTYVKATMKGSKKCKSPFAHLELSTVIRIYAMFDITRCLLLVGPMILLFFACKNVSPQESELEADNKYKEGTKKMMLYKSNPRDLSDTEYTMLANVEKTCGHDYINNFPTIWASGGETLDIALYLLGVSLCLPVISGLVVVIYHKRDIPSAVISIIHFGFEITSAVMGVYGAYFFNDFQLCFLAHFSDYLKISQTIFVLSVLNGLFYKFGMVYCLSLYVKHYCRKRTFEYVTPSPEEELRGYLLELKEMNIKPNYIPELPEDKSKWDWPMVKAAIRKMLNAVRLQMAELNSDDPVIDNLIRTGKLQNFHEHHVRSRQKDSERRLSEEGSRDSGGPNILKIARQMVSKNAEYKLYKHHEMKSGNDKDDDVDIILPGTAQEFDD